MRRWSYLVAALSAIAIVHLIAPPASAAPQSREDIEAIVKDYLATHPDDIGEIVKAYLIKNPDVLRDVFAELIKRRSLANAGPGADPSTAAKPAAERDAAVAANANLLFSSTHQVTLGNPSGDVTVVEFFDYNCGFCKRALPDLLALLRGDPKLKIVLKEFPILGPASAEAARVAIAVRMQDPAGQKYLAFHQQLLGSPGPADKDKALAAAKEQGLDMARLERDISGDEVRTTLEEDMRLAGAIGVNGTPGYVIGNRVLLGAVGAAALENRIGLARAGRTD